MPHKIDKTLCCFTIGHSNHNIEYFVNLLASQHINCVIDVRSVPYSNHTPQFNSNNLKMKLKEHNILYIYMGDLLGARYQNPDLLDSDGRVSFKKVRRTKEFNEGIERIINGIKQGYIIALMCAEKNPLDCHRFVLVSYQVAKKGILVKHILDNGKLITNDKLEEKLLEIYDNHFTSTTLFDSWQTKGEAIENGYEKRNKDIAYKNVEESKLNR